MSLQAILELLERQYAVQVRLLELGKAKKTAMIGNCVDDLIKITRQESKQLQTAEELERHRLEAMAALLPPGTPGNGSKPLAVSDLIRGVRDPGVRAALADVQRRMAEVVRELAELQELNRKLAEHSLAFIHYTLDLFAGGREPEVTYRHPQADRGRRASGLFDIKA